MRKQGFTLIELLVVVAVMSLLIGVLLPSLSVAREATRQTLCLSNLRNVVLGVRMYAQEHNDWLPPAEPERREFPDFRHWFMNAELLRNFALEPRLDEAGLPAGPPKSETILICPSQSEPTRWRDGTELDFALGYAANGTWGLGGRPDHLEHRRTNEFANPERTLAFVDARGLEVAPGIVLYKGCPKDNFEFRHRDQVNAGFLDGHAAAVGRDKVPLGMDRRYEDFWSAKAPQIRR